MTKKIKIFQVDAFTREKFKGNPAGVVIDADHLVESEMQIIARELNNSETAFILKPDDNRHFCKIRYFTPKTEVPFCGHATIASHHVLANIMHIKNHHYIQESNIGNIPIEINQYENHTQISLNQHQIEIGQIIKHQIKSDILTAIGIEKKDLIENYPVQVISTGHSKVIIPIMSLKILNRLEPNFHALSEISKLIKCNGYFVVTLEKNKDSQWTTHGRMFAPLIGIDEDPVTGNANGPLGVYLVCNQIITPIKGSIKFKAVQGEAIGRTGSMTVQVDVDAEKKPINTKITGMAVTVFETEISF